MFAAAVNTDKQNKKFIIMSAELLVQQSVGD